MKEWLVKINHSMTDKVGVMSSHIIQLLKFLIVIPPVNDLIYFNLLLKEYKYRILQIILIKPMCLLKIIKNHTFINEM